MDTNNNFKKGIKKAVVKKNLEDYFKENFSEISKEVFNEDKNKVDKKNKVNGSELKQNNLFKQNNYDSNKQKNSKYINKYANKERDKSKDEKSYDNLQKKNREFLNNFKISNNAKIKIIPLGGLNEIGMNITVIEDDKDIVVVDCGVMFPSEDLLGIDLVIPDFTYLKNHKEKIRGLVVTHGHEDHIGAIPYLLKEINVPIYATKLTIALIEGKLKEQKIVDANLNIVNFGDIIKLNNIYVEFIKTNHSIVDSCALAIYTNAGIIMHTGDFKVDYTPVFGDIIDLRHFAEIGRMGVLALLSDSTNAIKQGFTMSESIVGKTFDGIFNENIDKRIIVATFASNVDRVRQVINTAYKYGRKVVIEGRSMLNIINIASDLGYINVPNGTIIDIDMIKNYPDNKTVIVTTGSQGESMAALSRMASGTHKKINIKMDDVVILSSTPIPGNEKAVAKIINELSRKKANVIFQDTHVSGHACAEEIKLIYTLIGPKYAIPIHGEYRHRVEASNIAKSVGVKKENCIILDIGDVLEISDGVAKVKEKVTAGGIYVDGLLVGDVGNIVMKDRQNLANSGILIIAMTLSHVDSSLVSGPDLISKGFIYMKDSGKIIENVKKVVVDTITNCQKEKQTDWKKIKTLIQTNVSSYLWKTIKREPLIVTVIMNV